MIEATITSEYGLLICSMHSPMHEAPNLPTVKKHRSSEQGKSCLFSLYIIFVFIYVFICFHVCCLYCLDTLFRMWLEIGNIWKLTASKPLPSRQAESVSPARKRWGKVRCLYEGGFVMKGLLNDVRSRQTEGIYNLDWSNVSSNRPFTRELSEASETKGRRRNARETERMYARDWTKLPENPAELENWKRLRPGFLGCRFQSSIISFCNE